MIDVPKFQALLAELHEVEEKLLDRGPIKVLPRPAEEIPNVPLLTARLEAIQVRLRVKRKTAKAKGHDLDNNGAPLGHDLAAVGLVDQIQTIAKGRDRALPTSTTIVRAGFPGGEHLWFDPADLDALDDSLDVAKQPKAPKASAEKAGPTP